MLNDERKLCTLWFVWRVLPSSGLLLVWELVFLVKMMMKPVPTRAPSPPTPAPVPAPTDPPVRMPVSLPPRPELPTIEPTTSSLFEDVILVSSADNTVYRDGPLSETTHGDLDTMLVQNGPAGSIDRPDAYALVEFTLNGTDFSGLTDPEAVLCLEHVVNTEPTRAFIYSTCIVPSSDVDVETVTGTEVDYRIPDSCLSGEFASFTVTPSQEQICIDVTTDLLSALLSPGRLRRGRRKLQDVDSVLFIIDLQQESDQPGDSFYTRQTELPERHPVLFITQADDVGDNSTAVPTMDSSDNSTMVTGGDNDPCGICGTGLDLTLPDVVIPIPPEFLPPGIPPDVTCGEAEDICQNGGCTPDICTQIALAVNDICGCQVQV